MAEAAMTPRLAVTAVARAASPRAVPFDMAHNPIVPCIWFDDQAEKAAAFYVATFPDGKVVHAVRYPREGGNPSGKAPGSVMTVDFVVAGRRFTALNGGPMFKPNPSISFFVHLAHPQVFEALHAALLDGGTELMPLGAYPWSPRYAWVADKFGVTWQLSTAPGTPGPEIVPCLMYTREQNGRAREAVREYVAAFPDSRADVAGTVEGDGATLFPFELSGQRLAALDGGTGHDFGFTEGLSLQVFCADQAEIDHYSAALSSGGEVGPCGWVKDRYGVSWQVVPAVMLDWMGSRDLAAHERVFEALMPMHKIDLAALERAFRGG